MSYTYKHLTAAEVTAIKTDATKKPTAATPDDTLLRAWEADRAAHEALLAAKTGEDRKPHQDALAALDKALADAAKKP